MPTPLRKTRPPFVNLPRHKRGDMVIRLKGKIRKNAQEYGGRFSSNLMLNEPADLIGRESGRHYAEAGEVGTMEGVSADGQGGLNFTPTGIPQVGPQTQLAVGSAIMQLLSGRRSNQRRGRYKPAPVGSTPPPPSRRVNELLGVA